MGGGGGAESVSIRKSEVSTAKRDTMMSIVMDTFDLYSVFLIVFV